MFVHLGMKALGVGEPVCANCADILYSICISEGMGRENVLNLLLFEPTIFFILELSILLFIYLLGLMLSSLHPLLDAPLHLVRLRNSSSQV